MEKIVIMRGLPGAGKSSWVSRECPGHVVCSADQYFTGPDGAYRFEPSRIREAHASCFRRYLVALRKGLNVVVDNTGSQLWEMSPYVLAADAAERQYEIVEVRATPWEAAARNVHDVPPAAIARMAERWEDLPPWWPARVVSS